MIEKTGYKPAGTSGSYTPVKNVAFVAREFFPDQNDEVVDSRDGLYDDFGGDSYCITRNALYLGLTRGDDGYEPLCEETSEEYEARVYDGMDEDEDEDYCDDYEHYRSLEDADVRVAKAVKHALRLQKFFSRQRKQEQKAIKERLTAKTHHSVDDEPKMEVVEVWRICKVHASYADGFSSVRKGENTRRPVIGNRGGKSREDSKDVLVLAEVVVNEQRFRVSRAA